MHSVETGTCVLLPLNYFLPEPLARIFSPCAHPQPQNATSARSHFAALVYKVAAWLLLCYLSTLTICLMSVILSNHLKFMHASTTIPSRSKLCLITWLLKNSRLGTSIVRLATFSLDHDAPILTRCRSHHTFSLSPTVSGP